MKTKKYELWVSRSKVSATQGYSGKIYGPTEDLEEVNRVSKSLKKQRPSDTFKIVEVKSQLPSNVFLASIELIVSGIVWALKAWVRIGTLLNKKAMGVYRKRFDKN